MRVDRFEVEAFEPGPYPEATVLVECGSGTYMRTLAADLGTALGGCAHLGELRRLRVGSFTLDESRPLAEIEAAPDDAVLPLTVAMRDLERVDVDAEQARAVTHGVAFANGALAVDGPGPYALVDPAGDLLAVYETPRRRPQGRGRRGRGGLRRAVRIVDDLERLSAALGDPGRGSVVTIGVYDGVHLGHHAVLRLVRELADARDLAAVCVTFDRHPAEVVRPESAPKLITTPEQKLELLDATGFLDLCFVLHFDEARSQEPAEDFVREVLVDAAHARLVVVGADFHFGKGRGGDVALLQRMGAELGFEVIGLGLEAAAGGTIYSSTRIRELLATGDVAAAAALLGRPHEVRGHVVEGDRRGRELGYPTANVAVPGRCCLPADGIYAGTFLGEDGVETAHVDLARAPPHLLRVGRGVAARGLRPRLRRRPLRPGREGPVRRAAAR